MHVFHRCCQVVNTWNEARQISDFVRVDDLSRVEGLPCDTHRVGIDALAATPILSFSVLHDLRVGQFTIFLRVYDFIFTDLFIILNCKQVLAFMIPKQDADALEAEKLRQDLLAVENVVREATLS